MLVLYGWDEHGWDGGGAVQNVRWGGNKDAETVLESLLQTGLLIVSISYHIFLHLSSEKFTGQNSRYLSHCKSPVLYRSVLIKGATFDYWDAWREGYVWLLRCTPRHEWWMKLVDMRTGWSWGFWEPRGTAKRSSLVWLNGSDCSIAVQIYGRNYCSDKQWLKGRQIMPELFLFVK